MRIQRLLKLTADGLNILTKRHIRTTSTISQANKSHSYVRINQRFHSTENPKDHCNDSNYSYFKTWYLLPLLSGTALSAYYLGKSNSKQLLVEPPEPKPIEKSNDLKIEDLSDKEMINTIFPRICSDTEINRLKRRRKIIKKLEFASHYELKQMMDLEIFDEILKTYLKKKQSRDKELEFNEGYLYSNENFKIFKSLYFYRKKELRAHINCYVQLKKIYNPTDQALLELLEQQLDSEYFVSRIITIESIISKSNCDINLRQIKEWNNNLLEFYENMISTGLTSEQVDIFNNCSLIESSDRSSLTHFAKTTPLKIKSDEIVLYILSGPNIKIKLCNELIKLHYNYSPDVQKLKEEIVNSVLEQNSREITPSQNKTFDIEKDQMLEVLNKKNKSVELKIYLNAIENIVYANNITVVEAVDLLTYQPPIKIKALAIGIPLKTVKTISNKQAEILMLLFPKASLKFIKMLDDLDIKDNAILALRKLMLNEDKSAAEALTELLIKTKVEPIQTKSIFLFDYCEGYYWKLIYLFLDELRKPINLELPKIEDKVSTQYNSFKS